MKRDPLGRSSSKDPQSRLGLWALAAIILLLAAYLGVLEASRPHVEGVRLDYDRFVDLVERDRIENARLLDADGIVVGTFDLADGSTAPYYVSYFRAETVRSDLAGFLVTNDVSVEIDQQSGKRLLTPLMFLLPALIFIVIFVYLLLSQHRGHGLFGIRSGARRYGSGDNDVVTFKDVAGQDAAIAELREVVRFLKEPARFSEMGARTPKGILLYGPPGCGKTLMTRALAGEAGAAFFSISGGDFVEVYVGVGAARVRDLFKEARSHTPAIVFIDELDSVGHARGGLTKADSQGEQEQALNQLLAEMDGFSPNEGIIVIGATNRPDVLDQALLRPGRFDRSIGLERPDESAREQILRLHADGKKLDRDVDLEGVANRAHGFTGADLAYLMNESVLLAGREGRNSVSQANIDTAFQRILEAPERQRRLSLRDRSVGKRFVSEERVTFADVAGVDDAVEELQEIRDYLAEPERFERLGARPPKGILLAGPPGSGKTLLARAVAGETNAAFFSVAASEFVEVFVGGGAARVRDLFSEARSMAPAILFIDELDSVGERRTGGAMTGTKEFDQTLNQILIEMDGFDPSGGVVVMAATNRPDILDPALTRAGRFDRQIAVNLPDREGRLQIFEIHCRGKLLGPNVDLDQAAALTSGFAGADIESVMNEAALLAARRDSDAIGMDAILEGVERAALGVASSRVILSEEERRIVAYHEAGHALVGRSLPGADPPQRLTIVSRGSYLGASWHPDLLERKIHRRSALIDRMASLLAGRVAEQEVFGDLGDGAANDLEVTTGIAHRMVAELGMSEAVGPIHYVRSHDHAHRGSSRQPVPDEVTVLIDNEVRVLVSEAESRARKVIRSSRSSLDAIVDALLERETLSAADLDELLADIGEVTPISGS